MITVMQVPPEDVVNTSIFQYIPSEFHERMRTAIRRRMETGQDEPYEIEVASPVKGKRAVLVRGSIIDFDGSLAILNVLTDITEQKRAEAALRASEEKFRSFVENANDIVFSLTPDGITSYVSPNWREILGHDPAEIIGKPVRHIHPEDLPRVMAFVQQTMTSGKKAGGIEYRILHKDGSWQWHTQNISPVHDPDGNVVAIHGICHDITERKKAEEALRSANRQLTLLTGITRHDILNKISVINGFLTIAEGKSQDEAMHGFLKRIRDATSAIQLQIEFTRVYEALGTHEPQWTALEPVLPRGQVPPAVTLVADVKDILVYADPMLEKVFANLLDNSLRHGERVTAIRVSARISGGDLAITWEDNGVGIAADEKEQIFERGFGKNTGFGMFLGREILSLTGISICESGEPGTGARFEIRVPKGTYRIAGQ
jgi:PAS domain S-box-containing protein